MDRTSIAYVGFVAAALLLAAGERLLARRNESRLLREGAQEIAPGVFRLMAPVYAISFPAAVAEHFLAGRRPAAWLAVSMAVLFAAAKGLKLWAVRHLGDQWTMRVIVPRAVRVATGGPYRLMRHPNYLAVIGEGLAMPLAGGAWITAIAFAVLFGAILWMRIVTEEAALLARPEYAAAMAGRRRFLP
jgi:methyltransferase